MKKNNVVLDVFVALAFVSSAFAGYADGVYFYLKQGMDNAIHLSQSEIADPSCSPVKGCLSASFTDAVSANEWLVETLNNRWSNGKTLVFDTDIDFGGFDDSTPEDACDAQFVPLPFTSNGVVDGNGKNIKNLCYVHDVSTGAMVEPVGLFSQNVDAGSVTNLNIENVRIVVDDSRKAVNKDLDKDGSLFYPVGSLFGFAKNVTIENVTLKNVYIKAPFAGGVIGLASQSTVNEVVAIENIKIENDVDLDIGSVGNSGSGLAASNYAGMNLKDAYQPALFPSDYSVFLGGLVGVSKSSSISKSEVNAKISDLSSLDTRSALGGFVGLVSAEDGNFKYNDNKLVAVQQSSGKVSFTEILGGRAMGGFFGEITNMHVANEGYVGATFEIKNSKVDSLKITKAGSDSVYAGGLVGVFKSADNGRLAVDKSVAHVNIEDEVKTAGSFNYFAGGFLGASNTCSVSYGKQDVSGYVSIMNSNVFGNVHVVSSSKTVPSAKVKAFLGGVGGFVCFTADGSALKNDTSSVVVTSDVTTSSDSIFVGGFVGLADVYNYNVVLTVSDLVFNGEASAQMAKDKVSLGGIFGAFVQNQGPSVSFKNIYVKNEKNPILKLTSEGISQKSSVANVGGVCGNCSRVDEISLVSVVGNIVSDDKNFAGDSLNVGGIVGRTDGTGEIHVVNTYSVGDLSVASTSKAKSGYLVGYARLVSDTTHEFSHNFHYGKNDKVDAFGYITNGADITSTWKTNSNGVKENDTFSYNIRNGAVTNLSQKGKNGTKKNEEMQSENFAVLMNEGLEDEVWSQDDELNGKLPFFGKPQLNPELPETPVYTVKFMNGNVELLSVDVEEGKMPEYTGDEPTKASTAEYSYTFDTWSPTIVEAYKDDVYKAQFTAEKRVYTVKFMDGDRVMQESEVEYGMNVSFTESTEKPSTDQYNFRFVGWDKDISVVTGDAVYKAIYDSTLRQYRIKFMNGVNTVSDVFVDYGEMPECSNPGCENVTMPATEKFSFKFVGWSPELEKVTKDAVYKAVFDTALVLYDVVFISEGDTVMRTSLGYDSIPVCKNPTKAATKAYTYKFSRWNPDISPVKTNTVRVAEFDSTLNEYNVTFKNADVVLSKTLVKYGTVPVYTGNVPVKEATAQYTYEFSGWSPKIASVSGDAVYKAVFEEKIRKFDVVFISHEGDTLSKQTVEYGMAAVAPSDVKCDKHRFVKWDKDFDFVVENMVVVAIANDIPKSSSSSENPKSSSSSENPKSSSSLNSSSSTIVPPSSSSVAPDEPGSSSSHYRGHPGKKTLEIASADIEYSGKNAIRLNYVANVVDPGVKTSVHVEVVGENGVYLDTLLFDSLTTDVAKGDWQLVPAPIGSYEVVLTVKNEFDSVTTRTKFDVDGVIVAQPLSWQMVSLAALDEDFLARDKDAVYYWWDETNPIGDYWQYRKFDFKKTPDATRGFWYGSTKRDTLLLKAETPTKDSKIVWNLENRYSGWNLVANPHGWRIDLTKGKGGDVKFWRWNAETGEYEIPSTLGPYEAVWAKVRESTTWESSSQPVFDIKPVDAMSLAKAGTKSGWSLRAVLSDEFGKKDSWNFIGVGNSSENIEEPPTGMGDHVKLSIVEGKSYLAKSVKQESDEYSWNFEASATSARKAKLSFEGCEELAAQGLNLYVTANGRTQMVSGREPVEISLGNEPTQVKVRVAASTEVVSNDKLDGFNAISGNGRLQVNFNAGKNLSGTRAVVQLVALDGTIVSTSSFTTSYGINSASFTEPKRGVYFVRLKIGSQNLGGKVMVR